MASRTKFDSKKKREKEEQVNEKVYFHRFFESIDLEARSFQNPRIESIVSAGWKKDRSGLGHCPHPPHYLFRLSLSKATGIVNSGGGWLAFNPGKGRYFRFLSLGPAITTHVMARDQREQPPVAHPLQTKFPIFSNTLPDLEPR